MKKILTFILSAFAFVAVMGQTPQNPQRPPEEVVPEDIIRVTTSLVQTDVVVTDKNDQPVNDLKLADFELYENGKKQDIKFIEYVSVDEARRTEGARPANVAPRISVDAARELTARDLKRVFAFVVDDLTVPSPDLVYVRQALTDFVDNQMQEGDLVAIVRTVGGKGLLQQFTSDRQLLRRAIAQLNIVTNPFQSDNKSPQQEINEQLGGAMRAPAGVDTGNTSGDDVGGDSHGQDIGGAEDETSRLFRGLITLQTTTYLIESMKQLPGRKSLVLVSGGIPIFESSSSGAVYSSVSYLLNQLTDSAVRAGVVINTLDPRGLKASPGVASFTDTPGRSALGGGGGTDPNFGRGGSDALGLPLAGGAEHIGLNTLSSATGGVTIANMNDLKNGLKKITARSRGYYLIAYTPSDKFDNKFRKLQVKVKRDGVKIYNHSGYLAREEKANAAARTKEEMTLEAAKSPLAKRDVDLVANVGYKLTAANKAAVDINLIIEAKKLTFTPAADGKQQASFDVVGFLYDQYGKLRGGFSETVNASLNPEEYRRALKEGVTYTANTELPSGYFQFRAVVREESTGKLGTISRYLEIPNLNNGKLTMSSIYLFAADSSGKGGAQPIQSLRQISRNQELRYASVIYNTKRDGKAQTQLIISQGGSILFKESEQPLGGNDPTKVIKQGALGLSKVKPGRYLLTLIVTDPAADKKFNTISRSIDFTVVD
ncbi:MAG TPA: VWA domain-containing protein [Pyrinomonadaceae bacterium]|nr:VWA domain-containing protein [Pyrinomonadaceae bacterium]